MHYCYIYLGLAFHCEDLQHIIVERSIKD